jgi:hypothetical protein
MTKNDELPREAREGPIFHPDWGTHAFARFSGAIRGLDALLAMAFPMSWDTEQSRSGNTRHRKRPGARIFRESTCLIPPLISYLQLTAGERSKRYLTARRLRIENDYSGPWTIDVRHTMLSWQVAMRVSAVEVYLQMALTFLAVYDPEFMRSRKSVQEWTYDDARVAADSDDTVWTFCNQWARSFLGDGGPERWSKSLERFGLGTFDKVDIDKLEAMWGYRHMRVHHAGRFTREFVLRHKAAAERLWRDGLQFSDVERWSSAAVRFVGAAEYGIAGRLKAQLGPDLIKEREEAELERQLAMWEERREKGRADPEADREARIAKHISEMQEQSAIMDEVFGSEDDGASQSTPETPSS